MVFLDWCIVVCYMALVIILGVVAGRQEKSTDDYFLGGRAMPWWAVTLSIYATVASSLTFVGVPGAAFAGDFNYLQLAIGDLVGRLLVAYLLISAYYRARRYHSLRVLWQTFLGQRPALPAPCFF